MEFTGVFIFGLETSKGSNTILWNIQGLSFVLSGIFRLKVNKRKIPGGFLFFLELPNVRHQACKSESVAKNITSKQPLNCIRLIQIGNIQGWFVDLKLYFSLSKLIQSLFKSVFI